MPDEEKPTTETITLPAGGPVPGIPGHHAPGTYLVDWLKREITPVVQVVEEEIARVKKKIAPVEEAPATGKQPE